MKPSVIDGILQPSITTEFPEEGRVWNYVLPHVKKWSQTKGFVAVECGETDRHYSYSEVIEQSAKWVNRLLSFSKEHNIPPSDLRVTYILPNIPEYFILMLGNFRAHAQQCHLAYNRSADLLTYMLNELKSDILVIEDSTLKTLGNILSRLTKRPHIVIWDETFARSRTGSSGPISRQETTENYENLADVLEGECCTGGNNTCDVEGGSTNKISMIAFSSGTTGMPKAILQSQRKLVNTLSAASAVLYITDENVVPEKQRSVIGFFPMGHAFSLVFILLRSLIFGTKVVTYNGFEKNPEEYLHVIKKYQPPLVAVPVAHASYMAQRQNIAEELPNLKVLCTAGSPASFDAFSLLKERWGGALKLVDLYGCSEAGYIAISPPEGYDGTEVIGRPAQNVYIKLIHPATGRTIVKAGDLGEVLVKTDTIMLGYMNNPKATEEVFLDGWYRTGDIGIYDDRGMLRVVDRVAEKISVSNDVEIFPYEIEKILKHHPKIAEIGVTGLPVEIEGVLSHIPTAFVVVKNQYEHEIADADGKNTVAREISEYFKGKNTVKENFLGEVRFVKSLPRNPMGKLQRKLLKDIAWARTK